MNRAEEASLAWALVESAVFLRADARAWVCAKIGAGDLDSSIRDLLDGFGRYGAALPGELVISLMDWLGGYSGSDVEADLRHLVSRVRISATPVKQAAVSTAGRQQARLTATRRWSLARKTALPPAKATLTGSLGLPSRIEN
jgi:hypothetical protein